MADRPEPPPWGTLIAAALRRAGLSAREAARRAGISEGRWRQITGGYQVVSPGVYAPVRGPAGTVA
ncbi:MAG: helix-turn-helix transcriptional regulator, partial [Streptosporangiaceae bacterium]